MSEDAKAKKAEEIAARRKRLADIKDRIAAQRKARSERKEVTE